MPEANMQPLAADPQAAADQAVQATSSLAEDAAQAASDLSGQASSASVQGSGPTAFVPAEASAAPNAGTGTADSALNGAGSLQSASADAAQGLSAPPSASVPGGADAASAAGSPTGATPAADPSSLADPSAIADPSLLGGAAQSAPDPSILHSTAPDPGMLPGGMIDAGHSLFGTALVTAAYLCLILGVIFLAVWLLRRYGPAGIAKPKGTDNPRLLGRLMLGSKQSVCVVRVHGRNLVLGVTEERINLLAETDTPAGSCYEDEDEDDFTRFAEELAQKREQAVNRAAAGDPSDASDSEAHPCAGTGTSGSEQGAGGDEAEQHDRKLASAMSDLEHLAETSRHKG